MKQEIYDSKSGAQISFEPCTAGAVSIYVCGPTVQSAPHIGHLRSALVYDQMSRWLQATGHRVTLIRNVTDIDDKILEKAQSSETGEKWWQLAARVEREFNQSYQKLGIANPAAEPRATGHIPDIDALIERLFERGYAYQSSDGSIYFDTAKWAKYGELTNQSPADMAAAAEAASGKRNPADFALWKAHRDTEPADAKWRISRGAPGRPGWHIECSAMATRYLGSAFDIHGGGRDLRFPHHENELAQSAAAGDDFAKYWVHNGLINVGSQKMSKSLGNSLYASELLGSAEALVVRYMLGAAHYRSTLVYSDTSLQEAASAVGRIRHALERAASAEGVQLPAPIQSLSGLVDMVPADFAAAMYDDFAIPQALACVHNAVRGLNTALDAGELPRATEISAELVAMLGVLHLDPRDEQWAGDRVDSLVDGAGQVLDVLISELIAQRNTAREKRDWATSDAIRDRLKRAGVVLVDSGDNTSWSLN